MAGEVGISRAEVEALIAASEERVCAAVTRTLEGIVDSINTEVNAAIGALRPELVTGPTVRQIHRDPDGAIATIEEWAPYAG